LPEGLASSTEALRKHKQSFQLKKIKSVATDKWPRTDIKWPEQQKEFLEETTIIELLKQL
nr:hypothetical protein [Tanacetum cinerariifolium]